MKFTESQLESAIIELLGAREPEGSNDEVLMMSDELNATENMSERDLAFCP